MKKIVEITHDILKTYFIENCVCVDFTMGQGFDTLFLAKQKEISHVYAFDIQPQAKKITETLLAQENCLEKVDCILDGHEHCDTYVTSYQAGVFNFGYFPQGDKNITTLLETSKIAVEKALKLLNVHGALVLTLYPGHEEGKMESCYFDTWCKTLHSRYYSVMKICMQNKKDAPYVLVVEKIKEERK